MNRTTTRTIAAILAVAAVGGVVMLVQSRLAGEPARSTDEAIEAVNRGDRVWTADVVVVRLDVDGAKAAEVERDVATPAERALQGVTGLERLSSSSTEGRVVVEVWPKIEVDATVMRDSVEAALAGVTTFPPDTTPARITVEQRPRPPSRLRLVPP